MNSPTVAIFYKLPDALLMAAMRLAADLNNSLFCSSTSCEIFYELPIDEFFQRVEELLRGAIPFRCQ